jgi:hypothetical protein
MLLALLAWYGGPDQIMGVSSAVASFLGAALLFWNKLAAFFFKITLSSRRTPDDAIVAEEKSPDQTP